MPNDNSAFVTQCEIDHFIDLVFSSEQIYRAKKITNYLRSLWAFLPLDVRIASAEKIYQLLFKTCFPLPLYILSSQCKDFRCDDYELELIRDLDKGVLAGILWVKKWAIVLSNHYVANYSFDDFLSTMIHESFHAFLYFLTLCYFKQNAYQYIHVPTNIYEMAFHRKINKNNPLLLKIVNNNFVGIVDQCNNKLDSWFINVEILTEDLATTLYEEITNVNGYSLRGYETFSEFVEKRKKGFPSQDAAWKSCQFLFKN